MPTSILGYNWADRASNYYNILLSSTQKELNQAYYNIKENDFINSKQTKAWIEHVYDVATDGGTGFNKAYQ